MTVDEVMRFIRAERRRQMRAFLASVRFARMVTAQRPTQEHERAAAGRTAGEGDAEDREARTAGTHRENAGEACQQGGTGIAQRPSYDPAAFRAWLEEAAE